MTSITKKLLEALIETTCPEKGVAHEALMLIEELKADIINVNYITENNI